MIFNQIPLLRSVCVCVFWGECSRQCDVTGTDGKATPLFVFMVKFSSLQNATTEVRPIHLLIRYLSFSTNSFENPPFFFSVHLFFVVFVVSIEKWNL
jgi:hypothetical protein